MYSEVHTYGPTRHQADNASVAEFEGSGFANPIIVLRRYRWAIISFVAVIALMAAYYASIATPIYRGSSTILIEPQKANVVSIEEFVGVDSDHEDYYATQFAILQSRQLAVRVIDDLQLWDHPELSTRALKLNSIYEEKAVNDTRPVKVRLVEAVRDISFSDILDDSKTNLSNLFLRMTADEVSGSDAGSKSVHASENKVVDSSTFDSKYSSITDEQNQRVVLYRFINRLIITPVRRTKIVRISYESAYPEVAQAVANSVGEQYINSFLDSKQEATERTSNWLDSRLESLKQILDQSEQKLIFYKEANGLVDVNGSVGRLNEQELLLLTSELSNAQSALSSKTDVLRAIGSSNNNADLLQNIPSVQTNGIVQKIQIEKGVALRRYNELSNRYGKLHPQIIDIQSEIASLDTNLKIQIGQIARTISKERDLLFQRVASIQSNLEAGKREIQKLGTKKIELESLEREVATNQKIYDTYFNRMTEANSADGLETVNAKVVDLAQLPVAPIRPQKQMIVALSTFASLLLAVLSALLYDKLDRSVKTTSDVEKKLGTRMLGILPIVNSGLLSRKVRNPIHPMFARQHGRGFVEAVNTTKTALMIRDQEKYQQVIMVTSSVPGEGKSTISTNLASAFGKLGKVLLIDCDLRRPSLAKCAGIDRNSPGLSNLISGTISEKQCLYSGVISGIDLIPSGPIPDDPLEFLSSARFKSILSELCRYYDRIILDCAPTQAVSDSLILSQMCDSVIYVIKHQSTSIEMVESGLSRLREVSAPIAGVVLSQVDINRISKYAGDYYFQGYYDYYGYADQPEEKQSKSGKLKLTPSITNTLIDEHGIELDFSDTLGQARHDRRDANSIRLGHTGNYDGGSVHNGYHGRGISGNGYHDNHYQGHDNHYQGNGYNGNHGNGRGYQNDRRNGSALYERENGETQSSMSEQAEKGRFEHRANRTEQDMSSEFVTKKEFSHEKIVDGPRKPNLKTHTLTDILD